MWVRRDASLSFQQPVQYHNAIQCFVYHCGCDKTLYLQNGNFTEDGKTRQSLARFAAVSPLHTTAWEGQELSENNGVKKQSLHTQRPPPTTTQKEGERESERERKRDGEKCVSGQIKRFPRDRPEEHTSELQPPLINPYAAFCLNKKRIHFLTIRS